MAESESWRALMRGPARARVAMVTLCIAVHAMDVFVTATILPSVVADIGGAAFYAWPTAIYVVTDWIYGFSLFVAACVLLAAARLVWLLRQTRPQ